MVTGLRTRTLEGSVSHQRKHPTKFTPLVLLQHNEELTVTLRTDPFLREQVSCGSKGPASIFGQLCGTQTIPLSLRHWLWLFSFFIFIQLTGLPIMV